MTKKQVTISDVSPEQIYGALLDALHNNLDGWDQGPERDGVEQFINELCNSATDYPVN